ncbi:MAG: ATP-binding protein [Treponema sp.]|jgi:predicted AAA+ superfamily ATPase|nr:ATP-binding protein [Treponema sp.]
MAYIRRLLEDSIKNIVKTRPVVYLNGMRQCGKSTLAQNISIGKKLNYVTLDNPAHLAFAKNDPDGFLQQLPKKMLNVIDEVQYAPELFRYLKIAIDKNRLVDKNRALYVLTGSANIFALPKLADALVGRLSVLTLYPFSVSEIKETRVNFLEKLLNDDLLPAKYTRANIVGIISNATFPEIALDRKKNRYQWFNDYLTTLLQRDVRTLSDIRNPDNIYQLLVSLSQRAGGLLNNANVMKETGLDAKTYEKYKALCNNTFLTFEIPSWSKPNKLNKRFVKQKKLYFTDTSLLCHIMQRTMEEIYKNDKTVMGHIFENFIATEIMKAAKSLGSFSVSHFNPVQNHGKEVDFVIENENGKIIGIEVKLDGTINEKDWANMNTLRETAGNRFVKGVIIYTGTELIQVSRNIWAVPVNYLWQP